VPTSTVWRPSATRLRPPLSGVGACDEHLTGETLVLDGREHATRQEVVVHERHVHLVGITPPEVCHFTLSDDRITTGSKCLSHVATGFMGTAEMAGPPGTANGFGFPAEVVTWSMYGLAHSARAASPAILPTRVRFSRRSTFCVYRATRFRPAGSPPRPAITTLGGV
jgi:hypothetical protein